MRIDVDGGWRIEGVRLDQGVEVVGIAARIAARIEVDAEDLERRSGIRSHIKQQRHELAHRDHRPDSGVPQHESRVRGPIAGVDGNHDRTDPREAQPRERPFQPVRQHDCDAVAGADSGAGERRGDPVHPLGKLGEGE